MHFIGTTLSGGVGTTAAASLKHDVVFLLQIHFALGAQPTFFSTDSRHQVPARDRKVEDSGAAFSMFFTAIANLPTWRYGKELLDAGDVKPVVGQEATQASEPLQVVIGIVTLATAPSGLDQTFLFIDPQSARMNI
jgi:hypothetical protein